MRGTEARAAFVGTGSTPITRRSAGNILELAKQAALDAIADAGLDPAQIDGFIGAPAATDRDALHIDGADEVWCKGLVRALPLPNLRWAADLYRGFPTDMAACAMHAILAGTCRYVLGVRALFHLTPEQKSALSALRIEPRTASPVGARFAHRALEYFHRTGATRRDLYEITALSRRNAALNPLAIWQGRSVSCSDYLEAAILTDPFCIYDCDMPVCAAAAFVMAKGSAIPSGSSPAWIRGYGSTPHPEAVFAEARLKPADIRCAQLYDGFSAMVFDSLESLGLVPVDSAWKAFRDGFAARDGKLPVNTFGGSLGEGRMHGMGHLREAILQVTGRAASRQLPGADHCLVQVGPFDQSTCLIISSEP